MNFWFLFQILPFFFQNGGFSAINGKIFDISLTYFFDPRIPPLALKSIVNFSAYIWIKLRQQCCGTITGISISFQIWHTLISEINTIASLTQLRLTHHLINTNQEYIRFWSVLIKANFASQNKIFDLLPWWQSTFLININERIQCVMTIQGINSLDHRTFTVTLCYEVSIVNLLI